MSSVWASKGEPAMAGAHKDLLERRNFLQIAAGSAAALITSVPTVEAQQTEPQRSAAGANATEGTANAGGDNPYTRGMADFVAGCGFDPMDHRVIWRIKMFI